MSELMKELREKFLRWELATALGLQALPGEVDPFWFLSKPHSDSPLWWRTWCRLADKVMAEIDAEHFRFIEKTLRTGVPATFPMDSPIARGVRTLTKAGFGCYLLQEGYLVVFRWPEDGETLETLDPGHVVFTSGKPSLLTPSLFMEALLANWVHFANDVAKMAALRLLRPFQAKVLSQAAAAFKQACAISEDGQHITLADYVVVVKPEKSLVFSAAFFLDNKVVRHPGQRRWDGQTLLALNSAAKLIRAGEDTILVGTKECRLRVDSSPLGRGILSAKAARYLVVEEAALRGPLPEGGVPLMDYLLQHFTPFSTE